MNKFAQLGLSAVFVFGITAPASSAFESFSIDANSVNFAGSDINAIEYLDFIGNSFIQNTFSDPIAPGANFTFIDDGVFKISGVDGLPGGTYGGNELTTTFHAAGTGILGGDITFTSGILKFYSDASPDYGTAVGTYGADDGTLIGTFALTGGHASIDNDAIPNGFISLSFEATSLLANTWFDSAGNDLSLNPSTFGFVTSNATRLTQAGDLIKEELICGVAGHSCPTGDPFDNAPTNFLVSNNGQYRMSTVPEPSVLALLGIGLLGFGLRKSRHI